MGPGDRLALGIEAGRDAIIVIRPVHVVLDVFLAAPEHLHRAGDLFRHLHRPGDEIHLEPPAEAAAHEMVVHPGLGLRQPGHFGGGVLSEGRYLGSHPHVAAVRRTWTVQFTGSMVACARNGCSWIASTFCGAPAMAAATSPSLRAATPDFS